MMTADDFSDWIKHARPQDRIEYHRGYLPDDMTRSSVLAGVANKARDAYERLHVCLTQERHGPKDYSYFATRTKAPAIAFRFGR